jgi:hypothetical protein
MNESKIGITERLRREGRWDEATQYKDSVLVECREKGMKRSEASEAAWQAMVERYPPITAVETPAKSTETLGTEIGRIEGLSDVPASWGDLPANASLQAEIAWCQANRLRVVEERANGLVLVHLDRARTPAPSWAALGWLETSIRVYSKYIDVVAKALKDEENEQEMVKRERLAIDEIRSLLAEMIDEPV